jgi:hypothetical protein
MSTKTETTLTKTLSLSYGLSQTLRMGGTMASGMKKPENVMAMECRSTGMEPSMRGIGRAICETERPGTFIQMETGMRANS